jgi:arylsulfatase A-like enzyme
MVPPHAPYDPPPAHDLFTDPAYDGPCAGDRKTVARLDGGFIDPDPPCIEHMLALYDGNLRAADAAVGRIVETLRRRPTWDNTVILITSDHGEAFMEHGRLGHNTTVYGEMLHVPFVLRLPVGMEAPAVDTDQLVSLTDIAPTLAGLAGAGPLITPDGVDLLDPPPGSERRFIITRTATSPMQRGIRTSRWSMMLTSAGAGGLFDIAADPGESNDLRNRDPARSIGLGTVIETRFSAPPRISPSAATADITAEERELLEVLGYIRD